eukprot:808268-Ditylum_brightwellii.AAC.1
MTNKCNVIQRQAKQFKSHDADNKIKHNKNSDETCHHYSKQDLNAIIRESVKVTLKNPASVLASKRMQMTRTRAGQPEKEAMAQMTTLMVLMTI